MSKKLKILFIFILVSLAVSLSIFLLKGSTVLFSPQTWQITFSLDTNSKKITLQKISTLSQTFRPDYRGAVNSPYQLLVVDKNSLPLYQTKINITEELFHALLENYYQEASSAASPNDSPSTIDTTVFIPYFSKAAKIFLQKDGQTILEIKLDSKLNSLNFTFLKSTLAQSSPGPLQAVFISDGYSNEQQFLADVNSLKAVFQSTSPYSSKPNMFEFQAIYNTTSLGCVQYLGCITNPQIKTIGLSKNPNASKFIVLVKGNREPIFGLTNDLGGDTVILKVENAPHATFTQIGVHEFLGHSVGELYDRYVLTTKPGIKYNIRSNCTDNPSGEAFWRENGVQRVYRGCDTWNLYGPAPLECNPPYLGPAPGGELPSYPPPPGGPPLLNDGNRSSIMSGGACIGGGFDSVEQAWIRTQIMPRYEGRTLPTPTPSTPGSRPSLTRDNCLLNLTDGQILRGDISTIVSATRSSPSYYLVFSLVNSNLGTWVGAMSQADNLSVSWNSSKLFQNGRATLRCTITDRPVGGNVIFSKEVVVNVQN